ncbi:hypothetical protein MSG28_015706 [Choristoneura fumiferana]|uniref:Uncharacterized protein n=2 Tax=Choristoneura fumiferana TaxID=7141 RepID=A0ACC0KB63_CHOFU|nr:hypothetical protein MSG28_015706 [Choristoneura fumiferana]KAI8433713.1 hypothetical protein MSG28_015706 [Choristoneura fumiferana]
MYPKQQLVNDADIQSALIPQELNPAFVPDDELPVEAYNDTMKWLQLVLLIGDQDYTGHYAELAAPVPAHINVDDLVASLRSASPIHNASPPREPHSE